MVDLAIWQDRLSALRFPPILVLDCQFPLFLPACRAAFRVSLYVRQSSRRKLYRANPGKEGYLLFSPWILSYAKHLIRALVATPQSNMGHPVSLHGRFKDSDYFRMSPYHVDHASQSIHHEASGHNSDYVPTPGYCASPDPTSSALSPSRSCLLENSLDSKSKCGPHPLRFLPLHEWEEEGRMMRNLQPVSTTV